MLNVVFSGWKTYYFCRLSTKIEPCPARLFVLVPHDKKEPQKIYKSNDEHENHDEEEHGKSEQENGEQQQDFKENEEQEADKTGDLKTPYRRIYRQIPFEGDDAISLMKSEDTWTVMGTSFPKKGNIHNKYF